MEVEALNLGGYQAFIESYPRVVVHFWADWNLHDKEMRERLNELAKHYGNSIKFASFDTSPEVHWEKCNELDIKAIPALVFYNKGKHYKTVVGLSNRENTETEL